MVQMLLTDNGFWINFNDLLEEGFWRWGTQTSPSNYTNWAGGEPNNEKGDENCGMIFNSGLWNDGQCAWTHHYICKRPQNE